MAALWESPADTALSRDVRGVAGQRELGSRDSAGDARGCRRELGGKTTQRFHRLESVAQTLGHSVHGKIREAIRLRRIVVCGSRCADRTVGTSGKNPDAPQLHFLQSAPAP